MIKLLTTLLLVLFGVYVYAQNTSRIEKLVSLKRTQTEFVSAENTATTTAISSIFAQEQVAKSKEGLKELTIIKVYYVYTKYKRSSGFNQKELDRKRFRSLEEVFPEIIDDPYVEWELIEQTGCKDYTEGTDYFHGFVLVHRPMMSEAQRLDEINRLSQFFKDPKDEFSEPVIDIIQQKIKKKEGTSSEVLPSKPDLPAKFIDGEYALFNYFQNNLKVTKEVSTKRDDLWVDVRFEVDENGVVSQITFEGEYASYIQDAVREVISTMPEWQPASLNDESVSSEVNLQVRVSYSRSVNGMYKRDGSKPTFSDDVGAPGLVIESSESEKNENEKITAIKSTAVYLGMSIADPSEKIALVMDVTGSMTVNVAAMKRWISNNPESLTITSYTFFNDGDGKRTRKKSIGGTGGQYLTRSMSEVEETIKTAMSAGSGGERSESDVESLLYAAEHDSLCDALFLIGDNYSEVRDLSLLKELNKKVHVLVCSARNAVRVDYLNIVRSTGGTLILNGKKVDLMNIEKGGSIQIGKTLYDYNGKIFRIKN
jgi:hypothetical protein